MKSEDEFWANFTREGECLVWNGETTDRGYGRVSWQGKAWVTHRLAYLLTHGSVPPAPLIVRHKCDVRACGEPNHLIPGTKADNGRDMAERGRGLNRRGIRHPENPRVGTQVTVYVPDPLWDRYKELREKVYGSEGVGAPSVSSLLQDSIKREIVSLDTTVRADDQHIQKEAGK